MTKEHSIWIGPQIDELTPVVGLMKGCSKEDARIIIGRYTGYNEEERKIFVHDEINSVTVECSLIKAITESELANHLLPFRSAT